MNRLVIGLALSLLLRTPAMAAFDFRGFALGMPMTEFRATLYPDDPASGLKPSCSDGPYSSLSEWRMTAVGIIHCNFMGEVVPRDYAGPGLDLKLGVGDFASRYGRYFFAFAPDEAGTPRLYKISLGAHNDAFNGLVEQATARFGPPTSVTESPKNWPEGSPYRRVYRWRVGSTYLVIEARERRDLDAKTYAEDNVDILYIDAGRDDALRKAMAAVRYDDNAPRYLAAPYLHRYMALDMRLDVFKTLPYPDDPRLGQPLCTDGDKVRLENPSMVAAGVVHCSWEAKAPRTTGDPARPVLLRHNAGAKDAYSRGGAYHYAFAPDAFGVKRLYRISLRAPLSAFQAIIASKTSQYGPPTITEVPQDWPVGSPYRQVYTWESYGHRIVVKAGEQRVQGPGYYPEDGMSIEYVSVAHAEAMTKAIAALTPPRNPLGK